MRNERFYDRQRLSKSKKKIKENKLKRNASYNTYQKDYSFGDFLSDVGNLGMQEFFESRQVQAKLNVSQSGDIFEQEADRIAKDIVNKKTSKKSKISRVQKKSNTKNKSVDSNAESKIKGLKGKGHPLKDPIREYFESHFDASLNNIRIHTDSEANQLASYIHAKAFTHGNDIVFGKGQYQPETTSGKELIAHELTHTMQQGEGLQRDVVQRKSVSRDDPAAVELVKFLESCNMNVLGIAESGLNAPLHYEYLIKGSQWSWMTLFTQLNNIGDPSLFRIFVQPFLKTAVYSSYARKFFNYNPLYGEDTYIPENLRISESDAKDLIWALFTPNSPIIDWNTWFNSGYWDETKDAFIDFIGKYFHYIPEEATKNDSYISSDMLDNIFAKSTPDMLDKYTQISIAMAEVGLLEYGIAKRIGDVKSENHGYRSLENAARILGLARNHYSIQEENFKESVSKITGFVQSIVEKILSAIPVVKALGIITGPLLTELNSMFVDMLVNEAFNSKFDSYKLQVSFDNFIKKLVKENVVEEGQISNLKTTYYAILGFLIKRVK